MVGPSSSVLLAKHGTSIDNHSLILRTRPKSGYETHVGFKTGFRIMDSLPEQNNIDGKSGEQFLVTSTAVAAPGAIESIKILNQRALRAAILHPVFEAQVKSLFNPSQKAEESLISMVLAMNLCNHVDGYGIAPWSG